MSSISDYNSCCKSCRSTQRRIYKGVAHNIASLRCANCGHFYKWLSKAEFNATGLNPDTLPEYHHSSAPGQLSLWGDA